MNFVFHLPSILVTKRNLTYNIALEFSIQRLHVYPILEHYKGTRGYPRDCSVREGDLFLEFRRYDGEGELRIEIVVEWF